MTSIQIDIRDGLSSSTAIKGPCKVASTANLTLSGTQTVDGVAAGVDDRVLVKDQTTPSENGIYVVDTGPWRRSKDFNRTKDVKTGTLVCVTSGATGQGFWQVTTADPIVVGTTSINFTETLLEAVPSGVGLYESKTELAASTVAASLNVIQVAGDAVAGDDNGGEIVTLVRDTGGTLPGYLLDGAGTHFANLSRTIKFNKMNHGAETGGVNSNTAAWAAACAEIKAKGGGCIKVPPGQYAFAAGQTLFTMDCNVEIDFHPDALFVGLSSIGDPIISLAGASGTGRGAYKWVFNNPRIDQSLGANAGNQPSGIHLLNVREVIGYGGYFQGGADWETSPTVGGDSALEPINTTEFKWDGGYFEGWIDAGLYAGGGNDLTTVDDGIRYDMINAYIKRCGQGITFKRSGNLLVASGNYIELCSIGITSADVGAGQEVKTGQRMVINDNTIKKTVGRAIGVRGQTVAEISDNWLEDWGYDTTGVTLGAAAPSLGRQAILCQGGQKSNFVNNVFRMKDWVESSHVGILSTTYIDGDGTTWATGQHFGDGNKFNCAIPVYDVGTTNVTASWWGANRVDDVSITLPSFRNGGVFEQSSSGNTHRIYYIGNVSNVGVRTIEPRETFSLKLQGSLLTSIGSLASATTSSIVTVTATGADNGDTVLITLNSSAGLNSRLNIAARAVADAIEVQVRNDHTAAVDFTALDLTILVIRRDQ